MQKFRVYQFLFEELVKRDFKKKYKGTILGMGWSMLSPLLLLFVMKIVFDNFFGRTMPHYTTYLFCGNILYAWFAEATNSGLGSLVLNSAIFTKVNVPKYLFVFSRNIQTAINFGLTFVVFFLFCWIDHISFTWRIILLIYPIFTLLLLNIGVGMILSTWQVFFRDVEYLWRVALQFIMYGSAIFYPIDVLPVKVQQVLNFNPLYLHIAYFRDIVIDGIIPNWQTHFTLLGFALAALLVGGWMYKHYNTKFLYYV